MCNVTWDLVMYMYHGELRLYQGYKQIGKAAYRLTGKGGLYPAKFDSTKKKMDPVIDDLLKRFPIQGSGS